MNKWWFEFKFPTEGDPLKLGRGWLELNEGGIPVLSLKARTGSVGKDLKLKNAIYPGIWSIQHDCEVTKEKGMVVDSTKDAMKIRLLTPSNKWSHFLFHADGNKPGSAGCIVTSPEYGNCETLFKFTDNIRKTQFIIPVYINTPVPEGVLDGSDI